MGLLALSFALATLRVLNGSDWFKPLAGFASLIILCSIVRVLQVRRSGRH